MMARSAPIYPVYLATGDSLTGGYYTTAADGSKRFAALVAASLQALGHASTFATHQNPGSGIDVALASLRASLAQYEPQILTVEWGINNINAGMAAATFQGKYSELLDLILESGPRRLVVCCNIPWFNYPGGGSEWNLSLQYNTAIAAEAAARSLPLADCWTPTALRTDYLSNAAITYSYPLTHVGDWLHPADAGHQAIHDAIWAVLRPELAGWQQSATGRTSASGRASASGRVVA